jgi:hypothetical protein
MPLSIERQAFVQQNPQAIRAGSESFAFSIDWMAISRVTDGN